MAHNFSIKLLGLAAVLNIFYGEVDSLLWVNRMVLVQNPEINFRLDIICKDMTEKLFINTGAKMEQNRMINKRDNLLLLNTLHHGKVKEADERDSDVILPLVGCKC